MSLITSRKIGTSSQGSIGMNQLSQLNQLKTIGSKGRNQIKTRDLNQEIQIKDHAHSRGRRNLLHWTIQVVQSVSPRNMNWIRARSSFFSHEFKGSPLCNIHDHASIVSKEDIVPFSARTANVKFVELTVAGCTNIPSFTLMPRSTASTLENG